MSKLKVTGRAREIVFYPRWPVVLNIVVGVIAAGGQSHSDEADVETGADGSFSFKTELDPSFEARLTGSALVVVKIDAYLPESAKQVEWYGGVVGTGTSTAAELWDLIEKEVQDLEYAVNLTDCGRYPLRLVRYEHDGQLSDVDVFAELMQGSTVKQVVPAPRDGDVYACHLITREDWLDDAAGYWLRWRIERPSIVGFGTEVIVRTPQMSGSTALAENSTGFVTWIEQKVGLGSILAGIPERIYQAPWLISDLVPRYEPGEDGDADKIRVVGHVGIAVSANGLLLNLCRLEAVFSLTLRSHESGPFEDAEFSSLFTVALTELDVDVIPGTDLDDLPLWATLLLMLFTGSDNFQVAIIALEAVISAIARDQLTAQIEQQLANAVNDGVDSAFEAQMRQLPDAIVFTEEELRAALFFEVSSMEMDVDNITIKGWTGLWHEVANLLAVDCGFSRAAMMMPVPTALQKFRGFELALRHADLQGWMAEYEKYKGELATLVRGNALLAAMMVTFALKHAPALGSAKRTVDKNAPRDFAAIAAAVAQQASPGLTELIGRARAVMDQSAGQTFGQLLPVAAKALPAPPSTTPEPVRKPRTKGGLPAGNAIFTSRPKSAGRR